MAGFPFRLKRVLEWRQLQCRLEENRLAACLASLDRAQQEIARLQAERTSIEQEIVARTEWAACELTALGAYRLQAGRQELEMEQERARRETAVREQTVVTQRAQRHVRLVEKLRDRQWEEFQAEENRALEGLAAEAYLSRWNGSHKVSTRV